MTYKEKYDRSERWQDKVFVMYLYHIKMLNRASYKWRIRDTANYFEVSMGLVSENIMLAGKLKEYEKIEHRKDALIALRNKR